LQESVRHNLEQTYNTRVELLDFKSIAGGCINSGGKLSTSQGDFFLKWNDAHQYPDMFKKEAKGLTLLKKSETVRIPSVMVVGETTQIQFIILEYIEPGRPNAAYSSDLGKRLAAMHKQSASSFGLDHDNYIGALPQCNAHHDHWISFFIEERLSPQLKLAIEKRQFDETARFEKLFKKLPELLPEETPSLLHGDLWSGNVITNQDGNAVLIDPAVYYGHREMDLAFTQLFGGFSTDFYKAYSEEFPLVPDFQSRVDLYNLYPLLVHVNLFGGSYANQVQAILNRFV
jgi:fructosamine-3-kinase